MRKPFIDVCGTFFDAQAWQGFLSMLAETAPQYFWKFQHRFAALGGIEMPAYRAALQRGGPQGAVAAMVAAGHLGSVTLAEHARGLRAQGAVRQVLHALPAPLPDGGCHAERLSAQAQAHGELFEVWAGLSLGDIDAAVARVQALVASGRVRGFNVTPFGDGVAPHDPRCAPLFGAIAESGLPVWVHCGQNYANRLPMDFCDWRAIDALAVTHPGLKIVVGHGGWPWIREMVAVCHRHRHVYLEFSTYRPSQMRMAGSGWEPLFGVGGAAIRGRILFGSTTWVHDVSEAEIVDELFACGLPEAVALDWSLRNAAGLLGLDPALLISPVQAAS